MLPAPNTLLSFVHRNKEDAGPTNNWMDPDGAKYKVGSLLNGSMRGRTMYVVPYIMGPTSSPYSKVGVEVTDSPYVVANMRIMSRMGKVASDRLGSSIDFVPGLHSLGDLDPMRRYIAHFPARATDLERGVRIRRKCAVGQKMFRAENRQLSGSEARLDGGTYADSWPGIARRKSDLYGGCVSQCMRENKSGDDGFRVWRSRVIAFGLLATTSRGCISGRTELCGRSIRRRDFSAWRRARG